MLQCVKCTLMEFATALKLFLFPSVFIHVQLLRESPVCAENLAYKTNYPNILLLITDIIFISRNLFSVFCTYSRVVNLHCQLDSFQITQEVVRQTHQRRKYLPLLWRKPFYGLGTRLKKTKREQIAVFICLPADTRWSVTSCSHPYVFLPWRTWWWTVNKYELFLPEGNIA